MPAASLVLPFAVPDKERGKAFTSSMEVASVLFLTEVKLRKRGLLEAKARKILFVSKLHYPLWAVPWESGSLIIDGLGVCVFIIMSQLLPDVTLFLEDIERGASHRILFQSALEKHEKTFSDFAETENVQVKALITDEELLSTFCEYVKEAVSLKLEGESAVVLAQSKIDQPSALEIAKKVPQLYKQIQSEIKSLEYVRNLLEENAKLHEKMILKEVELKHEACETEIAKLRPTVEKKVNQLLKERDPRIAKMNRIMENELKSEERELERREHELQRLELSKASSLSRREARKRRHDKIGVSHWEHRIQLHANKIQEVKARMHTLSEFIEKTHRQHETDTQRLRYGYQGLIDRERKKILDIEVQRDRDIQAKQNEIERLRLTTSRIMSQIEELAARKLEQQKELKKLAIPWRFEDTTLLCLPFYLVCYQTEKKTQFQIFPPFRVLSSEGILKTLQKTITSFRPAAGVKLFLQPRSKALSQMLDFVFEDMIESDKAFRESLLQAAASNNILTRQNFSEQLTKGVEELRVEAWISQKEGDALINAYT